jgi:hypothetical protein
MKHIYSHEIFNTVQYQYASLQRAKIAFLIHGNIRVYNCFIEVT